MQDNTRPGSMDNGPFIAIHGFSSLGPGNEESDFRVGRDGALQLCVQSDRVCTGILLTCGATNSAVELSKAM